MLCKFWTMNDIFNSLYRLEFEIRFCSRIECFWLIVKVKNRIHSWMIESAKDFIIRLFYFMFLCWISMSCLTHNSSVLFIQSSYHIITFIQQYHITCLAYGSLLKMLKKQQVTGWMPIKINQASLYLLVYLRTIHRYRSNYRFNRSIRKHFTEDKNFYSNTSIESKR